jgi:spore coat polysaccharide biosynthesis predicted glycosyltransferase SpsG
MVTADLIFTSAGRTVYEVASLGVPAIVLSQNAREQTHFFASEQHGFVNLGMGNCVSETQIREEFNCLCDGFEKRQIMSSRMKQVDLRGGRQRVQRLIRNILEE